MLFKSTIPWGASAPFEVSLKMTIWRTPSGPTNFPAVYAESTRYSASVTSAGECPQPNNEASAIRREKARTETFMPVIMQRGDARRQLLVSRVTGQVPYENFRCPATAFIRH